MVYSHNIGYRAIEKDCVDLLSIDLGVIHDTVLSEE